MIQGFSRTNDMNSPQLNTSVAPHSICNEFVGRDNAQLGHFGDCHLSDMVQPDNFACSMTEFLRQNDRARARIHTGWYIRDKDNNKQHLNKPHEKSQLNDGHGERLKAGAEATTP